MEITTFKKSIEDNTIALDSKDLYICIGKDITSEFIFDQYVHTFANNNLLDIVFVDELVGNTNFFADEITSVNVLKTDELKSIPNKCSGWVYCKSINKDLKKEYEDNIVSIPKLEKWQIIDYIISKCKVSKEQAEALYNVYKDIYKLDIELNKLSIFDNNVYDIVNDQILDKDEFIMFDLVNGIVQRDKNKVKAIYKSNLQIEPFALLSLLIKNFKQVIDIQLARNATAESVGMSGKQFWAVSKFSCNRYNRDELIYIYKFLTSLDLLVKAGKLDTKIMSDYIVFKLLEV